MAAVAEALAVAVLQAEDLAAAGAAAGKKVTTFILVITTLRGGFRCKKYLNPSFCNAIFVFQFRNLHNDTKQ